MMMFKAIKPQNEVLPLQRRINRYKKDRSSALGELRLTDGESPKLHTWDEIDRKVKELRTARNYKSEDEEEKEVGQIRNKKGQKGAAGAVEKGKGPMGGK